jgi:hypothetical protein
MTDRMEKRGVAEALEQVAAFMELQGENVFRVRTFRTVAKVVGGLPGTLREALDDGSLAATKASAQPASSDQRTCGHRALRALRLRGRAPGSWGLAISGLGV